MKTMRKIIVAILAIAVVMSTAILPAMAEANTSASSALTLTGRGGKGGPGGQKGGQPGNGQQMPGNGQQKQGKGRQPDGNRMPNNGQQPGNGQQPDNGQQMPGNGQQMPGNGQQPDNGQQMPNNGQMPDNGQQPGNGRQPMRGKGFKGNRGPMIDFDALVKDGAISQETRNAIDAYMRENGKQRDAQSAGGERPEDTLLQDLLDAEIITQEEYDAIAQAQSDEAPEAGSAPEAPSDAEAPDMPEASDDDAAEAPEARPQAGDPNML